MDKGMVQVICGEGIGKTSLAVGKGIGALIRQKTVIMIQFLKGNQEAEGLETLKPVSYTHLGIENGVKLGRELAGKLKKVPKEAVSLNGMAIGLTISAVSYTHLSAIKS